MLLNNLVSAAAAAALVLAAPAVAAPPLGAAPDALAPRDFDMRVQWSGNSACTALGPAREYSRNVCIPLGDTAWAVKIIDHNSKCKMRGYAGGNCGGSSKLAFSSHQCHRLNGVWSVRVEC